MPTSSGQTISVRIVARYLGLNVPISLRQLIRKANSPPPSITQFKVEPRLVSPQFNTTTLSWTIVNCDGWCSISITKLIPGVGDIVVFRDNHPTTGTAMDTVSRGTFYTLRASTAGKHTASSTTNVGSIS
jgi:hypothetical protein